jgi:hypothetical protein
VVRRNWDPPAIGVHPDHNQVAADPRLLPQLIAEGRQLFEAKFNEADGAGRPGATLSLRMNNQLEEVIYFDAVKLLAIDHPQDTEVYPNERLMPGPPYPDFKVFSVKGARAPIAAVDDRGNDILPLVSSIDRKYPEDFDKLKFKGYAREHAIELDPGRLNRQDRLLLLLTAWIDYADSTANVAASHAGAKLIPPYLQVRNARGEWQTVIEQMGFPAGLPKTMTVDLTGKFLCDDTRVRIVTSMRIYWDQILFAPSARSTESGNGLQTRSTMVSTTLSPIRAELRDRGFPREYSPDNRLPLVYDYRVIERDAPWKVHTGNYTRFGDVRELLLEAEGREMTLVEDDRMAQVDRTTVVRLSGQQIEQRA